MTSGDRVALVCLPYSGGNAYGYRALCSHLAPFVEPIALELPGHGRRMAEPLLDDVHAMTCDLAAQMEGRWPERWAVFGHSLGALLAYLLALRAVEAGAPRPQHLFVSGRGGPGVKRTGEPRHLMSQDRLIAELRAMGGSAEEILGNEELMELFLPILRADFEAADTYEPAPVIAALPVPLSAWIGRRDDVTREEARRWQEASTEPVTIKEFDGGHFFINDHVQELAGLVNAALGCDPARPAATCSRAAMGGVVQHGTC